MSFIKACAPIPGGDVERRIAEILLHNPHPNICKVLKINNDDNMTIEYEMLEPIGTKDNIDMEHVRRGLKHLHSLGIVYIDLHADNVCWSKETNMWKLIDFNGSGICDLEGKVWIEEPVGLRYYLDMLKHHGHIVPKFQYDTYMFKFFASLSS